MSSTLGVTMQQFGTTGVITEWTHQLQVSVLWSIKLGIEQARMNLGTELSDSDLATDHD